MTHPKAIATATVRTVFVIAPDKTVRDARLAPRGDRFGACRRERREGAPAGYEPRGDNREQHHARRERSDYRRDETPRVFAPAHR